jgi:predicted dehydrogenase
MREIRTYGSEGGGPQLRRSSYPYRTGLEWNRTRRCLDSSAVVLDVLAIVSFLVVHGCMHAATEISFLLSDPPGRNLLDWRSYSVHRRHMNRPTDRRSFIRQSLTAAFSIAASSRLAAASHSRILGSNDAVRVAVVGLRSKGSQHVDVFRALPGVRVVALCDVDSELLEREARKFTQAGQDVEKYRDVRKVIEHNSIDALVVATPNHWHALMGIWACQAGKDVYLEKPVSHSIWEGRKLVEAARRYDRIVQAGTQNRSDTGFLEALEYLREGHLGKVLWAYGLWYKDRQSLDRVDRPQPVSPTVDYDLWTGPARLVPLNRKNLHYDWHWFWDTGNGDMANLGAHQIDDCRLALGLKGFPQRVMSFGGRFVFSDGAETPNTQMAIFDYGETPVLVETRNLFHSKTERYMDNLRRVRDGGNILQYEGGYFAGGRGGGWVYDNDGKRVRQFPGDGGETHPANFIQAVRSRKPSDLRAEVEEGHISAALCHAANISYRLGKAATLDELTPPLKSPEVTEALDRLRTHIVLNQVDLSQNPLVFGPWLALDNSSEQFVGDSAAEANRFLRREEYRKPFVIPGSS